MSGFNFGQIGNIMSEFMDSDYIDIKRDDGSNLKEIYSNVPCHISFKATDNPDPISVDTKPIIQSIIIHTALWVDLKNDDFIVAKRMDNNGKLLKSYSGRCGNPVVSQGRQKVLMAMNATEGEIPTPVPPVNPTKIIVNYKSGEESIKNQTISQIEVGSTFIMSAPKIEGYIAVDALVDGESQGSEDVIIPNVTKDGNIVDFIYEKSEEIDSFRFLVNGLYTRDDGSLNKGYHLYKPVKVDASVKDGDEYTITCDNVKLIHEDNGKKLEIKEDVSIVLEPSSVFTKVVEILSTENNKITFKCKEYEPTDDEKDAYVTDWYN